MKLSQLASLNLDLGGAILLRQGNVSLLDWLKYLFIFWFSGENKKNPEDIQQQFYGNIILYLIIANSMIYTLLIIKNKFLWWYDYNISVTQVSAMRTVIGGDRQIYMKKL